MRRALWIVVRFSGPLIAMATFHRGHSSRARSRCILKKAACRAGMDAAKVRNTVGHSLCAGTATAAAIAGASEREISALIGHRSPEVRRYIRGANLFRASAAGRLGL